VESAPQIGFGVSHSNFNIVHRGVMRPVPEQRNGRFPPIADTPRASVLAHCGPSAQLLDGAGDMNECLIARLWRDARVSRIVGGTNGIIKEVVNRAI
jgi:hypothetical protein